jgi:hypothetical protein
MPITPPADVDPDSLSNLNLPAYELVGLADGDTFQFGFWNSGTCDVTPGTPPPLTGTQIIDYFANTPGGPVSIESVSEIQICAKASDVLGNESVFHLLLTDSPSSGFTKNPKEIHEKIDKLK